MANGGMNGFSMGEGGDISDIFEALFQGGIGGMGGMGNINIGDIGGLGGMGGGVRIGGSGRSRKNTKPNGPEEGKHLVAPLTFLPLPILTLV